MNLVDEFKVESLQGLEINILRNKSICILGGTGFIGTWIVSTLNELNKNFQLNIKITIYTRDKARATKKFARSQFNELSIVQFDFLSGSRNLGVFDYIVNGSTPTSSKPGIGTKDIFFYPTINAINSIIVTAKNVRNFPKVLNLSSGAVYGKQPFDVANQPESSAAEFEESDDYQQAKALSETLLMKPEVLEVLSPISPRLFAFYGPGLPLNQHFAVGNFIDDGLSGRAIKILGNPNTRRSYMHPIDLMAWLLKAMIDPRLGHFNVGSEKSISMIELAGLVSDLTSKKGIVLANIDSQPSNYVPSTENFRNNYNVRETIALTEGLKHWIDWLSKKD